MNGLKLHPTNFPFHFLVREFVRTMFSSHYNFHIPGNISKNRSSWVILALNALNIVTAFTVSRYSLNISNVV